MRNTVTEPRIEDLVRSIFASELPFFSEQDGLEMEIAERSVRISYSSFELSDAGSDHTGIDFHLRLDANEMWIGGLNVATTFRMNGVGRRLVQAAEYVATHTRMDGVNLFPLGSSRPFWIKLGYVPHRFTARVLWKPCGIRRTQSLGPRMQFRVRD